MSILSISEVILISTYLTIQNPITVSQRNAIGEFLGMNMFVSGHCKGMAVDSDDVRLVLRSLGEAGDDDTIYPAFAAALKAEQRLTMQGTAEATCRNLWRNFGINGDIGPGLIYDSRSKP